MELNIDDRIAIVRKQLTYIDKGTWAHDYWSRTLDKLRKIKVNRIRIRRIKIANKHPQKTVNS